METSAPTPVSAESAPPPPQETPAQAQARMFKVKIDGQEKEVPEDELLRDYQTREAANKRFQEAAEMKKQAEGFFKRLKDNPLEVLKDPAIGHDVRKLAEEYLVAQLQEEMMDPKDRELRDLKKFKEAKEAEEQERQRAEEEAKNAEIQAKYAEEYSAGIIEALETGSLPKTPFTVRKMAYYMAEGLKRGHNLTPKDVVPLVREDYIEDQKHFFSALDGQSMLDFLGKENADKLRKHELAKLKRPGVTTPPRGKSQAKAPAEKRPMSRSEWREMQRERALRLS